MLRRPFNRFLLRWAVNSLGIWVAANLFEKINYSKPSVVIIAGLLLALLNVFIKPLVVLLSLPAILLSLGLFMIVINGFMVALLSELYSPLQVESFSAAILAGLVIGLVNYLVTLIVGDLKK